MKVAVMPKAEQPPRATRAGARATHKNRFFMKHPL